MQLPVPHWNRASGFQSDLAVAPASAEAAQPLTHPENVIHYDISLPEGNTSSIGRHLVDSVETPRRKDWHATRELILETFARMAVDEGLRDVSIQQVADRAGVAHRTVYRHFPNRQTLVDELGDWLVERGLERGQITIPAEIDNLPDAIIANARAFDRDAEMMKALVLVTWESGQLSDSQQRRTEDTRELLDPLISDLDPEHARAVVSLIRYLISSRTWLVMREEFGLTGEQSGPVIAWTVQLMLEALRNPSGPRPTGAGREEVDDDS